MQLKQASKSHMLSEAPLFFGRLILAVLARYAFRVADATILPKNSAAMDDGQHSIAVEVPDRCQDQAAADASIVPRLAEQPDVEGIVRIVNFVFLHEVSLDVRKPVFEFWFCDHSFNELVVVSIVPPFASGLAERPPAVEERMEFNVVSALEPTPDLI